MFFLGQFKIVNNQMHRHKKNKKMIHFNLLQSKNNLNHLIYNI